MSKLEATFGPGRTRPKTPDRATIRRLVDSNKPLAVHTQRRMLDALEAAEHEVVAAKSVITHHIAETSLETARTAGIVVEEAVHAVVALMAIDPDRRAREAEARAEGAEQAVARVRDLHKRIPEGQPREGECAGCSDPGKDGFDYCCGEHYWPCPTIRALDGEQS